MRQSWQAIPTGRRESGPLGTGKLSNIPSAAALDSWEGGTSFRHDLLVCQSPGTEKSPLLIDLCYGWHFGYEQFPGQVSVAVD
jgi:hypothetical protein